MAGRTVLTGRVRAVCVGRAGVLDRGPRPVRSAMAKQPLDGPVRLGRLGFPGDEHVYEGHGGPDMAVLVCSAAHDGYWRSFGLDLPAAAAFGENLTVDGLTETEVCVGDTFAIGGAVVQVTQPRTPCHKLAARYGVRDLPVRMQETGFTGYLLRVLQEGDVAAGDVLRLLDREDHGLTVAQVGRIVNVDRWDAEAARRVLAVPSLGSAVRRTLEARLGGELGDHDTRLFGTDTGGG